mmetsp:Transcript_7849/g.15385  ORF Transcript_7849/g.15385 Transcript_7849/m.15385 type:complete len:104 (-) Transcript_7849:598-909(-)
MDSSKLSIVPNVVWFFGISTEKEQETFHFIDSLEESKISHDQARTSTMENAYMMLSMTFQRLLGHGVAEKWFLRIRLLSQLTASTDFIPGCMLQSRQNLLPIS